MEVSHHVFHTVALFDANLGGSETKVLEALDQMRLELKSALAKQNSTSKISASNADHGIVITETLT
jgi:hypothetical protein